MHKHLQQPLAQSFKDKNGKFVIWQSPNVPLWGWIVFTVLGYLIKNGHGHSGLQSLADASLLIWAYLEIRSGSSPFRRLLGIVVLAIVVLGFFKS